MDRTEHFDYYYGNELEQYTFYRLPKMLFTHEKFKLLSSDSKILYGLMLDRMGLSIKNKWLDKDSRVYIIYTLEQVMQDLNCGKDKGIKLFSDLLEIGLIERIKQGFGKPALIYVKNFISISNSENHKSQRLEESENLIESNKIDQVKGEDERKEAISNIDDSDYQKSFGRENISSDFGYSESINNKINQTNIDSIHPSSPQYINLWRKLLEKNIDYEVAIKECMKDDIDELLEIMLEVICTQREKVKIGGVEYPYALVKSRLLKINYFHIQYILRCLNTTTNKIHNIKSYLLTALFNSTVTINQYYKAEVNHDLSS